jgi:hypothetical protein
MRDSTVLPDLRILATEQVKPHEDCDPRRVERLCERFRQEGMLKNPVIVAAIPGTERFVVLDGANRSTALAEMRVPHLVVQLVSYADPGLILDTWYHVVSGLPFDSFENRLKQVPGLRLESSSLDQAREALSTNNAIAYVVCVKGVIQIRSDSDNFSINLGLLNQIVDTYRGRADIFRASNDIWEKQVPFYPQITALVIFPSLRPADILLAARNGQKLPGGITRHIIPNRALNIKIPLSVLSADWSTERKREWLHQWLMERMANNNIRYYSESTFSFDD